MTSLQMRQQLVRGLPRRLCVLVLGLLDNFILLELSEVLLIELVARSVCIQLALQAWCSLVGRRRRPQLGIAFRYPADEHLFVVVAPCLPSR